MSTVFAKVLACIKRLWARNWFAAACVTLLPMYGAMWVPGVECADETQRMAGPLRVHTGGKGGPSISLDFLRTRCRISLFGPDGACSAYSIPATLRDTPVVVEFRHCKAALGSGHLVTEIRSRGEPVPGFSRRELHDAFVRMNRPVYGGWSIAAIVMFVVTWWAFSLHRRVFGAAGAHAGT